MPFASHSWTCLGLLTLTACSSAEPAGTGGGSTGSSDPTVVTSSQGSTSGPEGLTTTGDTPTTSGGSLSASETNPGTDSGTLTTTNSDETGVIDTTGDVGSTGGDPPACGDGVVDAGEQCDGDLGEASCLALGFAGGALACVGCVLDTSGCGASSCGDGVVDDGEACDGADLGGLDCSALGIGEGALGCASDCLSFDASACIAS